MTTVVWCCKPVAERSKDVADLVGLDVARGKVLDGERALLLVEHALHRAVVDGVDGEVLQRPHVVDAQLLLQHAERHRLLARLVHQRRQRQLAQLAHLLLCERRRSSGHSSLCVAVAAVRKQAQLG